MIASARRGAVSALSDFDFRHQCAEQQCLQQSRIVAQVLGRRGVGLAKLDGLPGYAVLALQHRQQPLAVQTLRVVEVQAHAFARRVRRPRRSRRTGRPPGSAARARDRPDGPPATASISLSAVRSRCRAAETAINVCTSAWDERVDLAEHFSVGRGGQQGVEHVLAHLQDGHRRCHPSRGPLNENSPRERAASWHWRKR